MQIYANYVVHGLLKVITEITHLFFSETSHISITLKTSHISITLITLYKDPIHVVSPYWQSQLNLETSHNLAR